MMILFSDERNTAKKNAIREKVMFVLNLPIATQNRTEQISQQNKADKRQDNQTFLS
jgi:hypothetical protein